MTNILNVISRQSRNFIPQTPREYLALQIARKLNDDSAFRHYLVLFEHYPEELLLAAYQRCNAEGRLTGPEFMQTFRQLAIRQP